MTNIFRDSAVSWTYSVCRQIYAEARLLPFKENVLVRPTRKRRQFSLFIRELNPVQASAIGGLSFRCFQRLPQLSEPDAIRLADFTGLITGGRDRCLYYWLANKTSSGRSTERSRRPERDSCRSESPAVCVRLNVIADSVFLQSAHNALKTTGKPGLKRKKDPTLPAEQLNSTCSF